MPLTEERLQKRGKKEAKNGQRRLEKPKK